MNPSETIKKWEDEYDRRSLMGGMGISKGKLAPGWEIRIEADEEGRTGGPLALRQAIQRMENQMAARRLGIGSSDITGMDRDRQNRAVKDKAILNASKRNQVIDDEKRLKDSIVKMQRGLLLAGRKPNDDEQKQLWELQDEYEKALKKKVFFLAQHPEGDYMGWI